MIPVVPTPNLRSEMLRVDDRVRFQVGLTIIEGQVLYLNGAGGQLAVLVNNAPQWIPVSMCQLVEGAYGRQINHITPVVYTGGYQPGSAELQSLRSAYDSAQIEVQKLRAELNIVIDDLASAEKRNHWNYEQVCSERDALAADLKEALA